MSPTLPELLLCQVFRFCVNQLYLSCIVSGISFLFFIIFTWAAFVPGIRLLCCCTGNATELREPFYPQSFFTLHSFPTFDASTVAILQVQLDVASTFFFQGCRASETQTQPICLFGSHSVQWKVLPRRLYLCVKALQSTISTSSRFWTHSLITTYILKSMSYPLGGSSS